MTNSDNRPDGDPEENGAHSFWGAFNRWRTEVLDHLRKGASANSKLFILNKSRRPHRIERPPLLEIDRNKQPDAWRAALDNFCQGDFITKSKLIEVGVAEGDPLHSDVQELNEALVSHYVKIDYETRVRQNQYYTFQWAFSIIGFLTTLLATLSSIAASSNAQYTVTLTVLTIVFGGISAFLAGWYNYAKPQRKWYALRRIAEQLRKTYFLFLMRFHPYERADQDIAEIVENIENPAQEASDTSSSLTQKLREPLTPEEAKSVLELYLKLRVASQIAWYQDRKDEYEYNLVVTTLISIAIPSLLLPVASIINVLSPNAVCATSIVMLPTLAALAITAQRVYEWERQSRLYDDTIKKLNRLQVHYQKYLKPAGLLEGTFVQLLNECVDKAEKIFSSEADQWGQPLADDKVLSTEELIDVAAQKAGFNADQRRELQQKIAEFSAKVDPNNPGVQTN